METDMTIRYFFSYLFNIFFLKHTHFTLISGSNQRHYFLHAQSMGLCELTPYAKQNGCYSALRIGYPSAWQLRKAQLTGQDAKQNL